MCTVGLKLNLNGAYTECETELVCFPRCCVLIHEATHSASQALLLSQEDTAVKSVLSICPLWLLVAEISRLSGDRRMV